MYEVLHKILLQLHICVGNFATVKSSEGISFHSSFWLLPNSSNKNFNGFELNIKRADVSTKAKNII